MPSSLTSLLIWMQSKVKGILDWGADNSWKVQERVHREVDKKPLFPQDKLYSLKKVLRILLMTWKLQTFLQFPPSLFRYIFLCMYGCVCVCVVYLRILCQILHKKLKIARYILFPYLWTFNLVSGVQLEIHMFHI